MEFSYHTVYRTEGFTPNYARLTGAARFPLGQPGTDTWIFWQDADEEKNPVHVFIFESRTAADDKGAIKVRLQGGDEGVFIPVTIEDVKNSPGTYWLDPAQTEGAVQGDINLVWHQAEVPENYEGWVAPLDALITLEDVRRLDMTEDEIKVSIFMEARGIPAEIGAIHIWTDGYAYQKKGPYLWRRVPSDWTDEDPQGDLPENTARIFRVDGLWEPGRKAKHHEIIEKFFMGVDPVPEGETVNIQIMMGLPAAGKSTMLKARGHRNHAILDPDEIIEALPEFQMAKDRRVRTGAKAVYEEARCVNDLAIHEAIKRRVNFTISGTGGDLTWLQKEILPLADKGYRITLWMPHIHSLDELLIRSEARGERTGRFVPTERSAELWASLPRNFMRLKSDPRIAGAVLCETSTKEDRIEGTRDLVTIVATSERNEDGTENLVVFDDSFYSDFQKLVVEGIEADQVHGLSPELTQQLVDMAASIRQELAAVRAMPKKFAANGCIVDWLPDLTPIPYEKA